MDTSAGFLWDLWGIYFRFEYNSEKNVRYLKTVGNFPFFYFFLHQFFLKITHRSIKLSPRVPGNTSYCYKSKLKERIYSSTASFSRAFIGEVTLLWADRHINGFQDDVIFFYLCISIGRKLHHHKFYSFTYICSWFWNLHKLNIVTFNRYTFPLSWYELSIGKVR